MSGVLGKTDEERLIRIASGHSTFMDGHLASVPTSHGVAVLTYGSSSAIMHANRSMARFLRELGFTTLLLDLFARDESMPDAAARKVELNQLVSRLGIATDWLVANTETRGQPIGCLAMRTDATAVLSAAAEWPDVIQAVVCCGGQTDLVDDVLSRVVSPTLLIVGALDLPLVHTNREVLERLGTSAKRLEIIPGTNHLFEEPGSIGAAALLSANWFTRHLAGVETASIPRNSKLSSSKSHAR